ncbi:Tripeptidyl-peptidase [Actinidia chinensis var. chinensis]|uniref:Tripeptidyl-peptidase n=1 Tax=Actinidia chinensis var. chinensis TaxID=1590841 RepID=A0A2R6QGK0_ACTCC|nr:Tripeptidyl-peptidase [Actinidia chinensis var. chinensis]
MRGEKIEDRHPRQFYGCDNSVPFCILAQRVAQHANHPVTRQTTAQRFCQKVLWRASHLLSPDIPRERRRPLPLAQASKAIIVPSSLNNVILDITKVLARAAFVFSSVCTELQRRTPPSLLYSDSSEEVPALTRPDYVIMLGATVGVVKLQGEAAHMPPKSNVIRSV